MKIREKEPTDEGWVETVLNERWGARGEILVNGEKFEAGKLPALIAGERNGLATYQIRRANNIVFAELIENPSAK